MNTAPPLTQDTPRRVDPEGISDAAVSSALCAEPSAPIIDRFLAGYQSNRLQRALEPHEDELVREALGDFLLDEQGLHEGSPVEGLETLFERVARLNLSTKGNSCMQDIAMYVRALACRIVRAEQAVLMMREHLSMQRHHAPTRRGSG